PRVTIDPILESPQLPRAKPAVWKWISARSTCEMPDVRPVDAYVSPGRRHFDGRVERELRAPAAVHEIDDVALPRAVAHPAPDQRVAAVRALGTREAAAVQRNVECGSDLVEQPWRCHCLLARCTPKISSRGIGILWRDKL